MKTIALIYMGGTFGCVGEPLSPMPDQTFLPRLQASLPADIQTQCFAAPVIKDSSAYTAADWLALVQFIQQLQPKFEHFVVIHGTDTLSYASAVLARFLGESCKLILTGSQFPLLNVEATAVRTETDAKNNLDFALKQVSQVPAGVYLAFHQQLLHGRSALKAHTTHLNAFQGIASTETIQNHATATPIDTLQIEKAKTFNIVSLMMQPIALNLLQQNLEHLLQQPPHFLVLQGFGTGNLVTNPEIVALIKQLLAKNCLPVLSTQVSFGGIDQRYAVSSWVNDAQIVITDTLGHADLYAKALQLYLKYDHAEQWFSHWHDSAV
ncbi:asparaginase [Acinetobacter sp. MD2(2019)]|uniref:asparaginase n=1 Tax=Acinetobacter sp. MD2(2019) TaxID=2605273 RepID=UPI002D1F432B|nr:asparaginase [Acinetobacter sp. MD2(2019)]MEB3753067.1 asparaginase [Acinetobacter sp. MD2(2019)]